MTLEGGKMRLPDVGGTMKVKASRYPFVKDEKAPLGSMTALTGSLPQHADVPVSES
jgi:hypothetical protein